MTLQPMIALTVYFAVGLSHPAIERKPEMLHPDHLRELIIEVLSTAPDPRLDSAVAVELLMLTIATESHLGTHLKQNGGPALGIIQMEPATYEDLFTNYLRFPKQEPLARWVASYTYSDERDYLQLKGNIPYQIALARLHYWRVREPLPSDPSPLLLAHYWKKHYNTPKGKGTVSKARYDYRRLVLGEVDQ